MAHDKQLHFLAGLLISALIGFALQSPYYGLTGAVIAGILKEVRDWLTYGDFDVADMAVTGLGGLISCFSLMVI